MNQLIVTVGLPRSGKSTWANKMGYPIVSPDAIRLAIHGKQFINETELLVWTTAKYMIKSLFNAGHTTVIFDSTNITKQQRDDLVSNNWYRTFALFNVPVEECISRAQENTDLQYAIIRMFEQFEKVTEDELKENENIIYPCLKYKKEISIDFDGVLSKYTHTFDKNEILDIPNEGAIDFLINIVMHDGADKYNVSISSSRNKYDHNVMRNWFYKYIKEGFGHEMAKTILSYISFPLSKQPSFFHIDDRCIQFNGEFPKTIEEIDSFRQYYKKINIIKNPQIPIGIFEDFLCFKN